MPGSADHSGVRDGTDAGTVSNTLSSRLRHFSESVMHLIRPFAGLRPAPGRAAEVIAPPYDVLSSDEARKQAAGKPWSFLHISKPEIDLPAGTNPYAPAGLRQGSGEPEPHDARRRARTRRCALLLRLPPGHGRPYANRPGRSRRRSRSTTRTASASTSTRSRTRKTTASARSTR